MRIIDAEHLKRWILARWEKTYPRSAYPLRAIDIIDQVDREDTIDAEPVRHGKWMKKPAYKGAEFNIYTCSECGEPWWFTMKYCGNCGAKMDSNDSNALNALNALEIDEVNDE